MGRKQRSPRRHLKVGVLYNHGNNGKDEETLRLCSCNAKFPLHVFRDLDLGSQVLATYKHSIQHPHTHVLYTSEESANRQIWADLHHQDSLRSYILVPPGFRC